VKYEDFGITGKAYQDESDWDDIVRDIFGSEYRVADWRDLEKYHREGGDLLKLFNGLGLNEWSNSAFITRNGDKNYFWTDRHYFVTRHEHRKALNYLAHEHIDDYLISLGSWPGKRKILVVKRSFSKD